MIITIAMITILRMIAIFNKVLNDNDLSFKIYENDDNYEEADQTDHRHKGSLCCTQGAPFLQLWAIS